MYCKQLFKLCLVKHTLSLLGQALPHVAGEMAESLDRPHAPGQEHQGTAPLPDGQTCYPDSGEESPEGSLAGQVYQTVPVEHGTHCEAGKQKTAGELSQLGH